MTSCASGRFSCWRWIFLLLLLALLVLASLAFGSTALSWEAMQLWFMGKLEAESPIDYQILQNLRLPRTLTAAFAGAALATSGLLLQTLLRNPLAEPYILGAASGASLAVATVTLGVSLAGLTTLHTLGVVGAAGIGSFIILTILLLISSRVSISTLLLVGVMMGAMAAALSSMLVYFAAPDRIRSFLSWGFGDFSGTTLSQSIGLGVSILILLGFTLLLRKPLDALLLGEAGALRLGIRIGLYRWVLLGLTALLTSLVIAFCGPIGFVGIAVPHFCRGIFRTHSHRILLPAVMLAGAILVLAADLVSRLPGYEGTLPVNPLLALVGAPVVIAILLRQRTGTGGRW